MKYKAVIFDFDGTICDTGEGILKSAKYALDYYNIEAPEYTELTFFIGPPLLVTFQEKFGVDANMADKLVKKYRERYTNKGLLESELYDGIKELFSKSQHNKHQDTPSPISSSTTFIIPKDEEGKVCYKHTPSTKEII